MASAVSALLSLLVATPLGYLLSRFAFRGRWLVDTAIDIPIVLPPLVIGLSLLILFHLPLGGPNWNNWSNATWASASPMPSPPWCWRECRGLCLCRADDARTFDQIDTRAEQVALTLVAAAARRSFTSCCPRPGAECWALTIAWARSLGEFGPIIGFRRHTQYAPRCSPPRSSWNLALASSRRPWPCRC